MNNKENIKKVIKIFLKVLFIIGTIAGIAMIGYIIFVFYLITHFTDIM